MKKVLALVLLSSTILVGCSSTTNSTGTSDETVSSINIVDDSNANKITDLKVSLTEVEKTFTDFYEGADISSIQLEKSMGHYYYTVKGMDGTSKYKMKINADTGDVKSNKDEKLDKDDTQKEALDLKSIKGLDEVAKVAEKDFPNHKIVEAKLKVKHGVPTWKLEMKKGFREKEVKYNATDATLVSGDDYSNVVSGASLSKSSGKYIDKTFNTISSDISKSDYPDVVKKQWDELYQVVKKDMKNETVSEELSNQVSDFKNTVEKELNKADDKTKGSLSDLNDKLDSILSEVNADLKK